MIGTTILHYKIIEKLGEGGMGVVFKAEDTKLKRTVALKFLPKGLEAHEPERARFLQEAQAASALNHPNVCTIYDIREEGDQQFIVMEYVDGKTLRQLVPISKAQDAVSFAVQIGEALQEAHTHGIVHRDVKPENIMVNAKNQVRVMDFGLAKLKGSLKLTRTSSTVGTLAYMAPEHIQGGEVDARGDIFSFGIVLYEMLTGHLPFRGEHEAAMMYSIMSEDPESVLKHRPELSPELDRIIHRALEKDPEDRYQSVADMVSELRKVLKQSTKVVRTSVLPKAGSAPEAARESPEMVARRPVGIPRNILLPVIGAAAVVVVLYVTIFRTRAVELNPDMKFQTLQISFSQISYPSLSDDGNWIAFPAADANGKWDVYYMNVAVGEPRRVTFDSSANPIGNAGADISPDGGLIAYDRYEARGGRYDTYVVPSIGGRSKRIAETSVGSRWRRDGSRIGYIRYGRAERNAIWSVKPDGSDKRREILDTLSSLSGRIAFDWSPDGNSLVWLRTFAGGYQEIMRGDPKTGAMMQLTSDRKNIDEVCWSANDQIIFSSNKSGNTNLWLIPASGGQTVQITKGAGPDIGMSVTSDGKKLLYIQRQQAGYLWRASIDGRATRQLTTDERNIVWPSFSPDGRQIAFSMSDNDPLKSTGHIYVCDRDGNNRRQITSGDEIALWPVWSPNGRWISYYAYKSTQTSDSAKIYIVDAMDPGSPRALGSGWFSRWLDTTALLAFHPSKNNGSIITLDGQSTSLEYKDSVCLFPILDGNNVLLTDSRRGKTGWYIVAARNNRIIDGALPKRILTDFYPPNISPDKRYFYYSMEDGILRRLSLQNGKDERITGTFPGLSPIFSISSDGREIVYNDSRLNAKLVLIEDLFR